ncbi:glycosyltransferase family 1 protein [Vibrio parahaemolyticus]|uniref:glycosyltransferase family 4 protein n=2 Tax=Vibrio parahaemolyticus TaxID=670 RepID=UPI00111DD07E|nr:glycosyltransferase family 4 protein [Vibrio parahaemolyticus]TOG57356.1 glycosyltransferase family 1 protein [Vibrio parahaemolyticus]
MRICYIITRADEIGGAQVHVRDLCIALKKRGHDITVITGEGGLLVEQLNNNDIPVIISHNIKREIKFKYDLRAFFSLRKILKELSPDLLALHSSKAGILGRLVAKSLGIPTVFTVHGWSFAEGVKSNKRSLYMRIERLFCRYFSDQLITVSEQDRELALKNNIAEERIMTTVHNGICPPKYPSCYRDFSKETFKLVMVARFSEQKDHFTLLQALSKLSSSNWEIDLVGKGKLVGFYKSLAIDLGISEKVNFLGQRDDVEELLSKSDIFLLISNWEGYPISILEAMSYGLPVVASDVGGVRESVTHGYNGCLIPRGDVEYLKNTIDDLLHDKETLKAMSSNNLNDYLEKHTINAMTEKTLKVYDLCLSKS